jgi:hypothetical protein
MRTLQEKYNAVLEGTFSKEQFRRDAVMQLPNLVSKFNSFEDMTTILKNRGMIAEAKKEEVTAYKKPEVETADLIAPDLLDDGIKAELEAAKIEGTPSEEEYEKAKEKAAENLVKNPLHYKDAQTMPEMGKKKALKEDSQNSFLRAQEKLRDELSDKEMAAAVADEPASLAAAFRKKVMSMADEFKGTPEEVQAKLLAAWEEFKTNYHADKEGEQEFDKYAGAPMDAEIREGEGIQLTAAEMEKLRKEKKITLPDGRVLHYVGKPANEASEPIMVDGKEVDYDSIHFVVDFDSQDQPIYVPDQAKFTDGTPLTDDQLEALSAEHFSDFYANPEDVYDTDQFEGKKAQLKEAVKALIKKTLEA